MLYTPHNLHVTHNLHYSWTGWPSPAIRFPAEPTPAFFDTLAGLWATDGLQLVSHVWTGEQIQMTFKAGAPLAPVQIAARVKGRLSHASRQAGIPVAFSRKVALRTLGNNVTETVDQYLAGQAAHGDLADPRYAALLRAESFRDAAVDLDAPSATDSGRYWYNLHLVLVTAGRYRMGDRDFLAALRQAALNTLSDIGCRPLSLALMPDHIHLALRGNVAHAPLEIGLAVQNATAAAAGCRMWRDGFYAGTFGDYELARIGVR